MRSPCRLRRPPHTVQLSDSDDASMIDGCRVYGLVGGKETYGSLEEVAADIQHLGKQQNNCLDEIISLKGEIKLLKAVIARLEGDTVAHEAELTIGRGEPVGSSREKIQGSVRAEAAKRMNSDVTPSPPPTNVCVASSSGGKKIAFAVSPDDGFVVVGTRGRKAQRRRRNVAGPVAATAPDQVPVPAAVLVSSPRPGRRCIVELRLPLPLYHTRLGQVVRLHHGWCLLHPLPLLSQVPPALGFLRRPPSPIHASAMLRCASMLASELSFQSLPTLSVSA